MSDKSIDPNDPNFDPHFASLHHSLEERFPGIFTQDNPDEEDEGESDLDDEETEALEHYIPDDIQNDPRPRDERD